MGGWLMDGKEVEREKPCDRFGSTEKAPLSTKRQWQFDG